jgi:PAS domain S-box-containing protein
MRIDETLKILLVDDDDIDRMAVRRALRAAGVLADIREAASGADGLAALAADQYDCVLMDYGLADRDGLSVLREARAAGVKSPIIMLTGQGDEQLAVEIMKAGASDYLPKSRVSLDHLVQSVRTAIRVHEADQKTAAAVAMVAASEERYRSLVFTTAQIVWTTAADGMVLGDSPTWRTFTGQSLEEIQGVGWMDAVHPGDRGTIRESWISCVESRAAYEAEYRLRRHDGIYRHMIARGAPVVGEGSVIREWVGTCTDITERIAAEQERDQLLTHEQAARAEAEEAQLRLAFLADASKVLAASLNYEETLAAVTRLAVPSIGDWCAIDMLSDNGAIQLFALSHIDAQKSTIIARMRQLFPPRLTDPQGAGNVIRTGTPQLFSGVSPELLEAIAQDPQHLAMLRELGSRSVMIVPLESRGQRLGAITFVSAESARFYGPADLSLAEDLARRAAVAVDNARLFRHMGQAKDAAVAANQAKDQFLAVLSHELRTPLTPVLTTVQFLETEDDLSPEVRAALRMVRRNVELEARLIDDLLDLTRISKGKLQLAISTVDVHTLLTGVLEICDADIVSKHQHIAVRLDAVKSHVRADSARLQQVLWNLIKNAVKFTPVRGSISVATSNGPDGEVAIEVTDSGVGIEPDVMPRIFDAFEQGEQSVTRQFGGLGLGLAISKALVEGHGGQIFASSRGRDAGATFTVRLKTVDAPVTRAADPKPVSIGDRSSHLRILLVDDHEDTTRAMTRLLQRVGYEVRTASTVAAAMESAASGPFDVLISDIGLPDGSGLDLLRQLKATYGENHALKAIAISGFGMEEDLKKSREAGFTEHLTKPVNFLQLEGIIQELTAVPTG